MNINELSKISGVTTRTLRYYDEIGLLKPTRNDQSNYRVYNDKDLDTLEQILLYKELGFSLEDIISLLKNPKFNVMKAYEKHLLSLEERISHYQKLVDHVKKAMGHLERNTKMSKEEKFTALKKKMIDQNDQSYGAEVTKKWGEQIYKDSIQKVKNMTEDDFDKAKRLSDGIIENLLIAFKKKDPTSIEAITAFKMHKEWLLLYWPENHYSKEAHLGLTEMYTQDERFKQYYDRHIDGLAVFFNESMIHYLLHDE